MSQSGSLNATSSDPAIPTLFLTDSGFAIPTANIINVLGSGGATTSGIGNTIFIDATGAVGVSDITSQAPLTINGMVGGPFSGSLTMAITNATTTDVGVASYNSTNFSVTLGGQVLSSNFTITAGTGLSGGGSLTLGGSTTISLSTPVSGANGGTGVANTGLTIDLASGAVGKYLASDVSGNATWATLSTAAVTNITGTANQVFANGTSGSAQTGAVTLTLPQDIATSSTPQFSRLGLGTAATSLSSLTIADAYPYGISISGTPTAVDNLQQIVFSNVTQFSPSTTCNIIAGNFNSITARSPGAGNIFVAYGVYGLMNSVLSTIDNVVGVYGQAGQGFSGVSSRAYSIWGGPASGTYAASGAFEGGVLIGSSYVGSAATTTAPSNGLLVQGNTSIGSTTSTSLFNVGSAAQFQIGSTGIVTSGTWNGSVITGQYGGTGVANTGLIISLASGAVGKYMASDSSGNATWDTLSSAAVTSIAGTTNQINASASVGAVTLSLSSTIVTPGTLAVNGAANSFTTTTLNSTAAYNLMIQGTQTASTGSSFFQSGILIQSVFSQPNNGFLTSGVAAIPRFIAASGKNISLSAAYYAAINSSGNVGTLTNLAHFYSDGFVAVGGTATNVYGFYGADPGTGTSAVAAYFANISVGYSSVDLKGTNNAVFSGNMSVGSSSVTSLFNVGSSNDFQINSLGQVISGTWHGSVVELAYGGTNANLTASNGGIFYSTATAGAILSGTATANQVLLSGSSAAPSWSTATYPATTTVNQLLYSSSNNVIGGVTASNNGVLISGTTGIPSWLAAGTTGQVLVATTSNPASWATLSGIAVTSITGTANQITASASTGAVTLSFPATGGISVGSYQATTPPTGGIIAPGTVGFGVSSPNANSQFHVQGTPSSAASTTGFGTILQSTISGPSSGSADVIQAYIDPLFSAGAGTTDNMYGLYVSAGTSSSNPTVGYGAFVNNPGFGATKVALYSANLAIGSYTATAPPSNGAIISGQVAIGQSTTNGYLTIAGSVGITGSGNLPTTAGNYTWLASGFGSPNSGRLYLGDGTGWIWRMAKRSASTDTDLIYFKDNPSIGIGTSPVNTLDVNGSGAIGTYAGVNTAPSNGLIVSGQSAFGTASPSSAAQLSVSSTTAYAGYFVGTQIGVDGSTNQASLYVNPTLQPTNGATVSAGVYTVPVLITPSTKITTVACGHYVSLNTGSNVGTISNLIGGYFSVGNLTTNGTITNSYNIYVAQPLPNATGNYYAASIQGGYVCHRAPATGDYTLTTANYLLGVTSTAAARNVNLPATAPDAGWMIIIKDESGGAATNNITINRNGRTIDGAAANLTINTNYGVYRIYSDGSNYFTW